MLKKTCHSSHVASVFARGVTFLVLYGLTGALAGCGDDVIEDPTVAVSDSYYDYDAYDDPSSYDYDGPVTSYDSYDGPTVPYDSYDTPITTDAYDTLDTLDYDYDYDGYEYEFDSWDYDSYEYDYDSYDYDSYDYDGPTITTEPFTTGPMTTTEGTDGTQGTDGTGGTDGTDGTQGTDGTGTDGTDGTGGTDGTMTDGTGTDTEGEEQYFPEPEPFGDDVQELDLVGTWTLHWEELDGMYVWDPLTPWNSELTINELGEFVWREIDEACMSETLATGQVWVKGSQIVMHVDTWERALPWPSLEVLGEAMDPPFRMQLSYALLGPNLGLTAPPGITETAPYDGRNYIRVDATGQYLGGTWWGEAQMSAVPMGEMESFLMVRDTYKAFLDPDPTPDEMPYESTGSRSIQRVWWYPDPDIFEPVTFEGGGWTCLGDCGAAGQTLISGNNLYAYGQYAGVQRMSSFVSGKIFKRDVVSTCP